MLYFVNHYYEVTEENINVLQQMMKVERIYDYGNRYWNYSGISVGQVIGNNRTNDPKQTGYWLSKREMYQSDLKKVTTKVPIKPITIE